MTLAHKHELAPQVISFRGTRDRKSFAINLDTRLDRLEQSVDGIVDGTTPTASSLPPLHRGYSRAGRCVSSQQVFSPTWPYMCLQLSNEH